MLKLTKGMTTEYVITEIDSKMGGLTFPLNLTITNLMPLDLIHTLDRNKYLELDSNAKRNGKNKGEFEFKTQSNLVKFLENTLILMKLNGFKSSINLEFEQAQNVEVEPVEVEKPKEQKNKRRTRRGSK